MSKWIMVSDGTPQMMYAGKTDLSEEEIDLAIKERRTIALHECRAMRTILQPAGDGAISQSEMLSPLSIARAAMRVKVLPTAYFWPSENAATNDVLMRKIKPVEAAELQHRAQEAGLVTPDGMKTGSGGRLIS